MTIHPKIAEVTERVRQRSRESRALYLRRLDAAKKAGVRRAGLACGNLAHGFAACGVDDKAALKGDRHHHRL